MMFYDVVVAVSQILWATVGWDIVIAHLYDIIPTAKACFWA